MDKRLEMIEQVKFCQQMLNRIVEDVKEGDTYYYSGCLHNYTRIQDHITHLRRELLKLSKMLGGK